MILEERMAKIFPFKAVRPSAEYADIIPALPYDVYSRKEAKEVVKKSPHSFLAIDRPETQFDDDFDMYSDACYQKAADMLHEWTFEGSLIKEKTDCYYVYELTMAGRSQTGIVACASIDDYISNVIKKHENTRKEKEEDRVRHVDTCSAQTGPIFLAYRESADIKSVVSKIKSGSCIYDFTKEDEVRHRVWIVDNTDDINTIKNSFEEMDSIYIADGHHRCASACRVGMMRREAFPGYTGDEEFNKFLCVLFPDEELKILDYNRVVKDLNGYSKEEFIEKLHDIFEINEPAEEEICPKDKGYVSMYLDGQWYEMKMKDKVLNNDPVNGLDVAILQNNVLAPILNIKDPTTDNRIDFVGGIRGLKELKRRVDDNCKVAFAMYPTNISELFAVADAGLLMPPKSTWFEPKLRSGIFIHEI